ncbi:hypothetical protein I5I61_25305 [Pseudomonas nitroreducens]|uniref:Uncharacterized protein n=1 Tax=Pseudomonas nitroreducens TaxID=46680 RepID=A0ABS0KRY2_PSENT|nr:hypothetical protein [Pseudomonas nitroreducens]MBG6290789.1 hypothetical protein [Pseudomonas nitroreducens]
MSNILTSVRQGLIRRVEQITVDNGCLTNLGQQVRTGWLNEVLTDKSLPQQFVLIQKAPNRPPEGKPGALRMHVGYFVIGLVRTDVDAYEEALESMELDISQAFVPVEGLFPKWLPKGVTGVTVGSSDPFPPGNGQPYAGVIVPIHITTIIQEPIRR